MATVIPLSQHQPGGGRIALLEEALTRQLSLPAQHVNGAAGRQLPSLTSSQSSGYGYTG